MEKLTLQGLQRFTWPFADDADVCNTDRFEFQGVRNFWFSISVPAWQAIGSQTESEPGEAADN